MAPFHTTFPKIFQQRLARYPTQIDPPGLNGDFLKNLLKSFWLKCLPSPDPEKIGKKLLEWIKEPLVLFVYTRYRQGKGLHI